MKAISSLFLNIHFMVIPKKIKNKAKRTLWLLSLWGILSFVHQTDAGNNFYHRHKKILFWSGAGTISMGLIYVLLKKNKKNDQNDEKPENNTGTFPLSHGEDNSSQNVVKKQDVKQQNVEHQDVEHQDVKHHNVDHEDTSMNRLPNFNKQPNNKSNPLIPKNISRRNSSIIINENLNQEKKFRRNSDFQQEQLNDASQSNQEFMNKALEKGLLKLIDFEPSSPPKPHSKKITKPFSYEENPSKAINKDIMENQNQDISHNKRPRSSNNNSDNNDQKKNENILMEEKEPLWLDCISINLYKQNITPHLIKMRLQPLIEQWNISLTSETTWNPLSLVLAAYELFDSYDFYTKQNANNALLLLILRHIALGKKANINDYKNFETLNSITFLSEIEKIQNQLTSVGPFFFPMFLQRANKITSQEYDQGTQQLLKNIIYDIACNNIQHSNEKILFMKTGYDLRFKGNNAFEKTFIEKIINSIPIIFHKLSEKTQPKFIASTDSHGSFIQLIPLKKIAEFLNDPSDEEEAAVIIHCGDHVDRIGKESRISNFFSFIAYYVVAASELQLNALCSKIQPKKKIIFMLPPGNHDLWHKPSTKIKDPEWKNIESILNEYHLKSNDNNVQLQHFYLLLCTILHKRDIMFYNGNRMINAQHSCCTEPVILENNGSNIDEGSWLTWGRRIETEESLQILIETIEKSNSLEAKNLLAFIRSHIQSKKETLSTRLFNILDYGKQSWISENDDYQGNVIGVKLIDIIQQYNLTTWCGFSFLNFGALSNQRGYFIHNALIPFLGYLMLFLNNYHYINNVIQFFGHSHDADQGGIQLINTIIQAPPYPLSFISASNNTLEYTQHMILFHENKEQKNILLTQGIIPIFLPVHPKSVFEINKTQIGKYYNEEQFLTTILSAPNFNLAEQEIVQDEHISLKLSYYIILSKDVFAYKSIFDMRDPFTKLFNKNEQRKPLTITTTEYLKNTFSNKRKIYNPQEEVVQ